MPNDDKNNYLNFNTELNGIPAKDLQEIKKFSLKNLVFAFIRPYGKDRHYVHFISSNNYQFALSTQKRSDRPYEIRKFKSLETAINTSIKCGVVAATVISNKAKIGIFEKHLVITQGQEK